MVIRPALSNDADIAAKLIVASGENSLKAMFELSPQLTALGFIHYAFRQPLGQFSYSQHIVIEHNDVPIAIACSWEDTASEQYRQATLNNIIYFYGANLTYQIIEQSREVGEIIPAPLPNQLGVGHISALSSFQRQGLATSLLEHLCVNAQAMGKNELVLDVECSNLAAIKLYGKFGFNIISESHPTDKGVQLGLAAHFHMIYPIS